MLNTITDLITEVLVRGQQTTTSGHISEEMLNDWLTEKHRWAAGYKKWPFTEGHQSTTFASLITDEDSELRGEYPEGWKPDSIRLMTIESKRIRKLQFQAYKRFREDQPNSEKRVFTDYGRSYYINPNIDLGGTVSVWGQYTPNLDVTDNTASTVFSNVDEDGNEAIVEAMLANLKNRSNDPQAANNHMQKAVQLLNGVWERWKDENFGYETQSSMWEDINVLAGGMIGDIRRDRWY